MWNVNILFINHNAIGAKENLLNSKLYLKLQENIVIFAQININCIRYGLDQLVYNFKGKGDGLFETKLDDSFSTIQFIIEVYYISGLDRNEYGGGILLLVWDEIPSKVSLIKNFAIEGFFRELNLGKKKWLLCCNYNPDGSFILDHLSTIRSTPLEVIKIFH